MKKCIITLVVALIAFSAIAQIDPQSQPSQYVYCSVVGTSKLVGTQLNITVDFGEKLKVFADKRMKGEDGKALTFNTMIDALNFMGKRGWDFVQAYTVTYGNQNVYHYLMRKSVSSFSEEDRKEVEGGK